MIQLLFTFLFAEGAVALLLMAKTPLRRVLVKILDLSKRGMGPAVGKTIAATVSVLLASSLASIWKIRNRSIAIGNITPTDQVLMSKNALEASLMDEWWMNFGIDDLELQNLAIRILSQTCSSSGCERNWSVFEQIHTKRRNRLKHKRLNDLVYTHYNLRLKERQSSRKSLTDPIFLENIDLTDDWVVEAEDDDASLLDVDEIDDWMDVADAILDEGEGEAAAGYIIFLALVIDRLHHYLRELRQLKKNMEPLKKQPRISEDEYLRLKDEAKNSSDVINSLKEELSDMREKVKKMGAEFEVKEGEAKAAEANALSLKKQSEGLLLEYDRLLEDNQNLRSQLQTMERNVSRSDIKRDT